MDLSIERLETIRKKIKAVASQSDDVTLIAVSKTFDESHIEPALRHGHRDFGENRIQESQKKWPVLKEKYPETVLHLIGPLQSNKAENAVALFDVIHTVDREKIAKVLSEEMHKQARKLDVFVQVNVGEEPQKSGVLPRETSDFVKKCRTDYDLNVIGLMCIPPIGEAVSSYFQLLSDLAKANSLSQLSMGMSADYEEAIAYGATHVRVGSAIFGERAKKP